MREVLIALTLLVSASVHAQPATSTEGSLEQYEQLRARLAEADERLEAAAPRTDERDAATDHVLAASEALIDYLSAWMRDDAFPEALRRDAELQRFVLFENLVQLYVDRRSCTAARGAALSMRAVAPADLSDEFRSLFASASAVADRCVEWTPEPVVRELAPANDRRSETAGWVVVGVGTASALTAGVVAMLGIDERRDLRDARDAQQQSWTVEHDAELRELGPAVLRNQRAVIGLGAVGAALAGVGIALVVDRDERGDRVAVLPGPGQASVRVRW